MEIPPPLQKTTNLPVYVELTPGDADESALLLFRFQDPMALLRRWQIKVTQIRCSSVDRSGDSRTSECPCDKKFKNCFDKDPPAAACSTTPPPPADSPPSTFPRRRETSTSQTKYFI